MVRATVCNCPQPSHVVQVHYSLSPPMLYGHNIAPAHPCGMGNVTERAAPAWYIMMLVSINAELLETLELIRVARLH